MLTLLGNRLSGTFCDGLTRRSFLRLGSISAGACLAGHATAGEAPHGRSVITIYLPGGPTQHETFDPKPHAPTEIRGAFAGRPTAIPGTHFCELLPKLAASHHRFSVVRSLVGMENRHESFQCYTGRPGGRNGDNEPSGGWPTLGSVVSKVRGPGRDGMLPYVDASPAMSYRPYNNRGEHDASGVSSWPGFTGRQHIPFTLEGDIRSDLVLNGVDDARLRDRRTLLESLRRAGRLP